MGTDSVEYFESADAGTRSTLHEGLASVDGLHQEVLTHASTRSEYNVTLEW